MTRREKLLDEYEDSLFALIMDEFAEEEGKRLLEENERLKQDPNANIPIDTNKRYLRTISKTFARKRHQEVRTIFSKALKNVAVFVLAIIIMYGTAYAAFSEVRVQTLNFLIAVSDVSTRLTLVSVGDSPNSISTDKKLLYGYRIPNLPDEFVLEDEEISRKSSWVQYIDENDGNVGIVFSVTLGNGTVLNIDSEDAASIQKVEIHGFDGLLIEKNDRIDVVWGDTDHDALISVFSNGMDRETVIFYAEAITYID